MAQYVLLPDLIDPPPSDGPKAAPVLLTPTPNCDMYVLDMNSSLTAVREQYFAPCDELLQVRQSPQ